MQNRENEFNKSEYKGAALTSLACTAAHRINFLQMTLAWLIPGDLDTETAVWQTGLQSVNVTGVIRAFWLGWGGESSVLLGHTPSQGSRMFEYSWQVGRWLVDAVLKLLWVVSLFHFCLLETLKRSGDFPHFLIYFWYPFGDVFLSWVKGDIQVLKSYLQDTSL